MIKAHVQLVDRCLSCTVSAVQDTLSIRIDATLKQEAEKKAAERDETLSQVVRRALRDYVSEHGSRAGRTPKKNSSPKRV
jgi:hypothetical protein